MTSLVACLSFLFAPDLSAQNTSTTVSQVTSQVTLSADVDYHISGTDPFATAGSIDITNTDHAVVIFDAIRPSNAVALLDNITINGTKAVNDTNCQVRIYANGAMVLPYTDSNVLTTYTGAGLTGESCSDYDLSNTGGFMNTLTDEQLNNKIQSFRLKRGYMVTFALLPGGYGYSRCFIAAYNDLEVDLPNIMKNRISSYRVFKWNDVSKRGLANNTGNTYNDALNTQWCYSFGLGNDTGMDRECVPHKIHGGWPSTSSVGSVTYSPHMKTSNEPANSADDRPETVATVLGYWEGLMATGMRLCSPSQHDGGGGWTREFMDSIDARGWRCDIVDIHCYWQKWGLLNQVAGYYSSYKRPVWISEWLWGASWNGNGVFASSDPDNENASVLKEVLANWNAQDCVERYAYWNSESKGHLYDDGGITASGKVYRDYEVALAYDPNYEFVPQGWRITASYDLTATYNSKGSTCLLEWKDDNYDLIDTMLVQRKFGEDGEWENIASVEPREVRNATLQYRDTLDAAGLYTYRIFTRAYNNSTRVSSTACVTKGSALGNEQLQYGSIPVGDISASVNIPFGTTFESKPIVITGLLSNNNINTVAATYMGASSVSTSAFNYLAIPWQYQPSGTTTYTEPEEVAFLALPEGNYTWGDMTAEAKTVLLKDTTEFTFDVPFPEGVTPVVLATINRASSASRPTMHKIWNVSNTGFTATVMYEQGASTKVAVNQRLSYLAVSPGSECIDKANGIYLSAGLSSTNIYATIRSVYFTQGEGEEADTLKMKAPYFFGELQTANTPVPVIVRKTGEITKTITDEQGERYTYTVGMRVRRVVDKSVTETGNDSRPTADHIGWLAIHSPLTYDPVAIGSVHSDAAPALRVKVSNGVISVAGQSDIQVYSLSGASLDSRASLPRGIYVVRAGGQTQKVIVK